MLALPVTALVVRAFWRYSVAPQDVCSCVLAHVVISNHSLDSMLFVSCVFGLAMSLHASATGYWRSFVVSLVVLWFGSSPWSSSLGTVFAVSPIVFVRMESFFLYVLVVVVLELSTRGFCLGCFRTCVINFSC